MRKAFLTPRWLGLHALLVASLAVFGWIGWWQWDKGGNEGSWQNYGYGVQWWLFGAFAVFLWVKLVLDELDPDRVEARQKAADEPVVVPPVRAPAAQPAPATQVAADEGDDEELAAYNRHLAWLAQQGKQR